MPQNICSLKINVKHMENQSPLSQSMDQMSSENTWMVHCLSLATIGMLAYMQLAPIIA